MPGCLSLHQEEGAPRVMCAGGVQTLIYSNIALKLAHRAQAGGDGAEGHGQLAAGGAGARAPVPHPVCRQKVARPCVAPPPERLRAEDRLVRLRSWI